MQVCPEAIVPMWQAAIYSGWTCLYAPPDMPRRTSNTYDRKEERRKKKSVSFSLCLVNPKGTELQKHRARSSSEDDEERPPAKMSAPTLSSSADLPPIEFNASFTLPAISTIGILSRPNIPPAAAAVVPPLFSQHHLFARQHPPPPLHLAPPIATPPTQHFDMRLAPVQAPNIVIPTPSPLPTPLYRAQPPHLRPPLPRLPPPPKDFS